MAVKNKIYLDYQATTPMDAEVQKAMMNVMANVHGNPMSNHFAGSEAKNVVEGARKIIAQSLGTKSDEIIFTSGATESLNIAIKGLAHGLKAKGTHLITSQIEHKAVLETFYSLEKEGFQVSYLSVNNEGFINTSELKSLIREDTTLLALGHANNEIGVIQDIDTIKQITQKHNIHLFIDAAQSFGKVPLDLKGVGSLALSGHKIYGPKGIGALYMKKEWKQYMEPLIHGGDQEHGYRPGTHNVPAIAGLGKAVELAFKNQQNDMLEISALRNKLWDKLSAEIENIELNGALKNRLYNNLNFSLPDIPGELILNGLTDRYAFSTGSACMSNSESPSHVIKAIGKNNQTESIIRISIGRYTTETEIEAFFNDFTQLVQKIRKIRNF